MMPLMSPEPTGLPRACSRRRLLAGLGAGLGLGLLAGSPALATTPERLPIVVSDDVLRDYRRFLAGREPLEVQDFGGPHGRRDVAELVLLHKALAEGGGPRSTELLERPTSTRLKADLRAGVGACTGTSYWRRDFEDEDPDLLFSQPVLENGEFEVGLYTMPGNHLAQSARGLDDLRRLRLLSNREWRVDWETLVQLGLGDRLHHVSNWSNMPRMLQGGRADALLAPFQPGVDMVMQVDGITLLPIRGLKISMRGTRHYVLSRRHPDMAALLRQLDTGLQNLRRSGLIRQAYTQSGFFHPEVKRWTRL